jgi:hypothetical protein
VARTIEEAVEQLKRDPSQPVRTLIGGLAIEVRAVQAPAPEKSAAQVFEDIGAWAGESTAEILKILSDARREGGRRSVPRL